jgi:hypothetical protein
VPPEELPRALASLATLGGALEVAEIDGHPVHESPAAPLLRAAGFEPDGDRLRRSPLHALMIE